MAGRNQHYIPRFLQKAFGIRPKRKEIWYFSRGEAVERRPIKRTGSENSFYSEPTFEEQTTLDDVITRIESDIAASLNEVRRKLPGDVVAPPIAAAIISHLAQRTAHVRTTLSEGVARVLERTEKMFAERELAKGLIGLDDVVPTDRFRELAMSELVKTPEITSLGIPRRVLERFAFVIAKEKSGELAERASVLLDVLQRRSAEMVRDSHNKALGGAIGSAEYGALLQALDWKVESGPATGAILPDCVVIAFGPEAKVGNHLLVGADKLQALVLAVSPEKLLVGSKSGFALPGDFDYNVEAACWSHTFFLASRKDEETQRLHAMIGRKLRPAFVEAVDCGFVDIVPEGSKGEAKEDAQDIGALGWRATSGGRYELSLNGYSDERKMTRVRDAVVALVSQFAGVMPLERLEGIMIGSNYPELLRAVRRGWENAPLPDTVPPEVGIGVAQVVTVRRSGMVKGCIVASTIISDALVSEDTDEQAWGTYAFAREIAEVALMEIVEGCLPGTLLEPVGEGIDGWLYANVDGALESYAASWTAGAFGDAERIAIDLRELLAAGVDRMMTVVPWERLAYREHGNLDRLLGIARPAIRHVLRVAAALLGHCAFTGVSPLGRSTVLDDALDGAKLQSWLGVYHDDLARFHLRLGRWESFEEFLAFNIHAERLLLAVGMFVWEAPEGLRFEVPLGTDAEALLARHRDG